MRDFDHGNNEKKDLAACGSSFLNDKLHTIDEEKIQVGPVPVQTALKTASETFISLD